MLDPSTEWAARAAKYRDRGSFGILNPAPSTLQAPSIGPRPTKSLIRSMKGRTKSLIRISPSYCAVCTGRRGAVAHCQRDIPVDAVSTQANAGDGRAGQRR